MQIHRIPIITMFVDSPNPMTKYEPWCAATLIPIPYRSEGLTHRGDLRSAYGETREKAIEALQKQLQELFEGNLKEVRIGIQTISIMTDE